MFAPVILPLEPVVINELAVILFAPVISPEPDPDVDIMIRKNDDQDENSSSNINNITNTKSIKPSNNSSLKSNIIESEVPIKKTAVPIKNKTILIICCYLFLS